MKNDIYVTYNKTANKALVKFWNKWCDNEVCSTLYWGV